MEAITREEIFLAKIIGETVPDIEPIVRKEMFLARIAGMDIPAIEPITREEMFLNAIANKEVIDLKPITRREMFLAKAMGADIEVPNPITRAEFYLSQMTGGKPEEPEQPENPPVDPADKYTWEGVFASIDKGTYATDYAIGDTVPLDLGSEGLINMQIVAFDTDDLADGSGKAPITWIAKELLATKHRANPSIVTNDDGTYQEGTGNIGGWEKCEMRTYLKETIKPLLPDTVRSAIKEVTKQQKAFNTNNAVFAQTTNDDIWLPEYNEIFNSSSPYNAMFPDTASTQKKIVGDADKSQWWLRSASLSDRFNCVLKYGGNSNDPVTNSNGVCLCFCT